MDDDRTTVGLQPALQHPEGTELYTWYLRVREVQTDDTNDHLDWTLRRPEHQSTRSA